MKLDLDCVRDVLLTVESNTDITDRFAYKAVKLNEVIGELPQYSPQDVFYTALKLEEAKFITISRESNMRRAPNDFAITDITYAGHEYLNSVRDIRMWKKIKSTADSFAISAVTQIAQTLLLSTIGGQ